MTCLYVGADDCIIIIVIIIIVIVIVIIIIVIVIAILYYFRNVHLAVKGTGILPGLSLSHSDISFAATPYGTSSTVRLAILNPRLSRMDSAVIRGGAPPSGTKMFEFRVPDQVPVIISPHTGSVDTGKVIILLSLLS